MADNLYAALPASEERAGLHTEDQCVVSPATATWPARCVVCNRPDELQSTTIRARYVATWLWLLFPAWAVIMALLPSARVRLVVSVCATHARRRTVARWVAGGLTVLGVGVLFVPNGEFVALGLIVAAALALVIPGAQPVRVAELKGEVGWFLVGDAFHASLPARATSRPSLELDLD